MFKKTGGLKRTVNRKRLPKAANQMNGGSAEPLPVSVTAPRMSLYGLEDFRESLRFCTPAAKGKKCEALKRAEGKEQK
jgi:hypothetical protein